MAKEIKNKSEEITDILVDITHYVIRKQKTNTLAFYPVYIDKENHIDIKVKKEEDKYKILLFGDKWKKIKKSDIEAIEILLTLNQLLIQAFKMVQQMNKYNK